MKKICLLLCLLTFFITASAAAQPSEQNTAPSNTTEQQTVQQVNQPLKVAIMPIIANGYDKVQAQLYRDLTRQVNLSLNKTLQKAVYLEGHSVFSAMEESGFLYNQNEDTLKYTAKLLDADVIVGYSVPVMYQQYYYGWMLHGDGPLLQSFIRLKLWAYYKPLNKVIALSNTQQYFDEVSTAGTLTALASDASYNLTKKADLKNLLKESIEVQNKSGQSAPSDQKQMKGDAK